MRNITEAFHRFMSYESPHTMRQRVGLSIALLAGIVVFVVTYRLMFHEFFSTSLPGPRPLMVWVCAAIFLGASLLPRLVPMMMATFPRAIINAFLQGIGALAILGLGMSYFDTLPLPFSAIGYFIFLLGVYFLVGMPSRIKPTQDPTSSRNSRPNQQGVLLAHRSRPAP